MRNTSQRLFNNGRTAGVTRDKIMCSFREWVHLLAVNNIRVCVGIIVTAWRIKNVRSITTFCNMQGLETL